MKLLLLLSLITLLSGCVRRICEFETVDPNGVVTGRGRYQSNFIATETTADYFKITTPRGIVLEFNRLKQDNDSIKVIAPYGIIETTK